MNLIARIFAALGIDRTQPKVTTESRLMPSSTKRGPGRKHKQGDGTRTSEQRQAGAYGRGLRNHINRANGLRLSASRARDMRAAVRGMG